MVRFFPLAYLLAWICWGAAAMLADAPLRTPLLSLGTFAPGLAAVGLTASDEGRSGLEALWSRISIPPNSARWYLFAIGYIAAVKLAATPLQFLIARASPAFGTESGFVIAAAIVISTPVQMGEELGWRGYALPRLAARFGLARASLLLGFIWGIWHLPLFFVPGIGNFGQSFPVFVVGSIILSVAIAWLYGHTDRSLLLAMLMHSAANQTTGIVPTRLENPGNPLALDTSLITMLTRAIGLATAGYFLARMPRVTVS